MTESPPEVDIIAGFGGTTDYGQRFAIYIPNRDRDGAPVDQTTWIDAALQLLTDIAGGATAMPPVTGAWRNPQTGQVVIEEPVVVYAYVRPAPFVARLRELAAFVRRMGRETNHGAIALEFDGNFFTVEDFAPDHSPSGQGGPGRWQSRTRIRPANPGSLPEPRGAALWTYHAGRRQLASPTS
jgi:hypothetical protein